MKHVTCPHCGKPINSLFESLGKRGGLTTKKRGTAYFRAIGRRGSAKRWKRSPRSGKARRA